MRPQPRRRTLRSSQTRVHYDDRYQTLDEIVAELGITQSGPVIVVFGSAKTLVANAIPRIERFLAKTVAPIAKERSVAVVYGGTDAGVMALLGRALIEFAPSVPLIGVAPKALVAFDGREPPAGGAHADRRHTHFVTTPGTRWGDEADALIGITERLARTDTVVAIALGGQQGTLNEVSYAAQRHWPLLVVTHMDTSSDNMQSSSTPHQQMLSRGARNTMATTIATTSDLLGMYLSSRATSRRRDHIRPSRSPSPAPRTDPAWDDIADATKRGGLLALRLSDHNGVRRALTWCLTPDRLMKEAWLRVGAVNQVAQRAKPPLQKLKVLILLLGLLTTVIALALPWLPPALTNAGRVTLLVLAAISGALVAFIARRRRDARWITVRAGAQALNRELYRFRTHAGDYWTAHQNKTDRRMFASALATINNRLSQQLSPSIHHQAFEIWPPASLIHTVDPRDTLLDMLDGETYDTIRVEHQLRYFTRSVGRADRALDRFLIMVYGASVASLLAEELLFQFTQLEVWVSLVVAIAAAIVLWLTYGHLEQQVHHATVAVTGVQGARQRWLVHTDVGTRNAEEPVSVFATEAEDALESEALQWEHMLKQAYRAFIGSNSGNA